MTNTGGNTIPAGWHTDPGGSGHLRWWDGTAWTAHLAPQPTPAPTPTPTPVVPQPIVSQPVQYTPVEQQPVAVTADNQPYVPFQGSWNAQSYNSGINAGAGEFARPAEWNTPWSWFLAAWPIYFLGLAYGWAIFYTQLRSQPGSTGTAELLSGIVGLIEIVILVLTISAAFRDRATLRRWGYLSPASPWWILLGPLIYLIVRTVKVYGEVRKGIAPLIFYIVATVVVGLIYTLIVATVGAAFLQGAGLSSSSAQFATSLQTGLDEKGGHFTVSCPATIPTNVGSTFSCTAVDSAGSSHVLDIQVVTGTDGRPSVKLQSVTPPITG